MQPRDMMLVGAVGAIVAASGLRSRPVGGGLGAEMTLPPASGHVPAGDLALCPVL